MVALRIDARCLSCDSIDLTQITDEENVEYIACSYCGATRPLAEIQEKITKEYNKFMQEGVSAVVYKKSGWFM